MTATNIAQLEFHQRVENAMAHAGNRNYGARFRDPSIVKMDSSWMNAMAPSNYTICWKHDVVEVLINPSPNSYKFTLFIQEPFPAEEWFDLQFTIAKKHLEDCLRKTQEAREHLEFLTDQTPKISIDTLIKPQTPIQKLMDLFTSNPELLSQAADIITVAQETTVKVEQDV